MKTNWILPLSLVLNAALLAYGVALRQDRERPAAADLAAPPLAAALSPKAPETSPMADAPETHSIQWGDLVSGDDSTYARNLRAIGCPEGTIRDLITAAVGHRYDQQRQDLVVQHQQGRIDTATMQAAVAQTWEQQNNAVSQLPAALPRLASAAAPAGGGASASAIGAGFTPASGQLASGGAGVAGTGPARNLAVAMPMALTDPPASLGLNEAQVAAAARVGDNFANTVNAQNLAPTDPAYHRLWRTAQMIADDELKAQIGGPAFVQWQIQQAQIQAQTPNK